MENKDKFEYTYSAPTEEEKRRIEEIKSRYIKDPTSEGLKRLKALDDKVKRIPTLSAVAVGTVGTLVTGTGLSMVLHWGELSWGSVVGVVGIFLVASANAFYNLLHKKMEEKYGKEIVALSDRLLKNE